MFAEAGSGGGHHWKQWIGIPRALGAEESVMRASRSTTFAAPAGLSQPRENSVCGDIRRGGASSDVTTSELASRDIISHHARERRRGVRTTKMLTKTVLCVSNGNADRNNNSIGDPLHFCTKNQTTRRRQQSPTKILR